MSVPRLSALDNLAPRERGLVLFAGMLIVLFIIWQFIVSPVLDERAEANRMLETAKRDFQIVSNGVQKLPSQNGGQSKTAFTQNDIIEAPISLSRACNRVITVQSNFGWMIARHSAFIAFYLISTRALTPVQ